MESSQIKNIILGTLLCTLIGTTIQSIIYENEHSTET